MKIKTPLVHGIDPSWTDILKDELNSPAFDALIHFIASEYRQHTIFPKESDIFKALNLCPFDSVKVIILGQDPYHGDDQANGLAFAVSKNTPLPPSLKNIFKEIETDTGIQPLQNGDLGRWALQGVLLLNATLSVRSGAPGSHQNKGWEEFTDAIIKKLSDKKDNLVFILWGNYAKKKGAYIDKTKHFIIESPHPSPLSAYAGFFGSKPFSKTNTYLKENNIKEIDWK